MKYVIIGGVAAGASAANTCCAVGLRGYLAERILKQNGFKVFNLSGGWATWRLFHPVE